MYSDEWVKMKAAKLYGEVDFHLKSQTYWPRIIQPACSQADLAIDAHLGQN